MSLVFSSLSCLLEILFALSCFHNYLLCVCVPYVRTLHLYLSRICHSDHRGGRPGQTESKKIFVGGLPPSVTNEDFRAYFEDYGKITDAIVMIDRDTQRSRGFGFVSFEEEGAVAEVLSKNHELHGKTVEIKRAEPKGDYSRGGGGRGGYGDYGHGGRGGGYGGRGGRGGRGGYGGGGYGGGGGYPGYGGYGGGYGGYGGGGYGGGGYGGGGYGGGGYGGGGRGGYGGGYYGAAAGYGGPPAAAGYGYGGYSGYYPGYDTSGGTLPEGSGRAEDPSASAYPPQSGYGSYPRQGQHGAKSERYRPY